MGKGLKCCPDQSEEDGANLEKQKEANWATLRDGTQRLWRKCLVLYPHSVVGGRTHTKQGKMSNFGSFAFL